MIAAWTWRMGGSSSTAIGALAGVSGLSTALGVLVAVSAALVLLAPGALGGRRPAAEAF